MPATAPATIDTPGAPSITSVADAGRASARRAAIAAALVLSLVYGLTLAPSVTFWDAGEFLAAVASFGVPHPPGTPLFVLLARAWALLLPVSTALAGSLLSAACTVAACAALAWLVARWTGSAVAAVAAAIAAGSCSSVWLSATETEVYPAALLLSAAMLLCGERRAHAGDARWTVLLAFLYALAIPLHLSALVAAPAAALLAVSRLPRGEALREGAVLAAAAVVAAGAGRVSGATVMAGLVLLAAALVAWREPVPRRLLVPLVLALGLSPVVVMLVRAGFDPAVNQGNPATLDALLYALARRQYAVAPLLPRQAPAWLQLANIFQWADWQWALGVAPRAELSAPRAAVTLAFGALAIVGGLAHRRLAPRAAAAWGVLLLSATVGVAAYLNLKAGPSFGWGVLPDDAPHEARERDYFFALGFWAWGAWAGLGAVHLARRALRHRHAALAGLAVAALPVALNWRTASRRDVVEAQLPAALARALLEGAPRDAVLLVAGDNDTYPLWYLQQAEGVRRDVTVVTLPLLGAAWYREELARRHALLPASLGGAWPGQAVVLAALAARTAERGRPLAAAVTLAPDERLRAGRAWTLQGHVYLRDPAGAPGPAEMDTAAIAGAAARGPGALATAGDAVVRAGDAVPVDGLRASPDRTAQVMLAVLACPVAALRAGGEPAARRLLDSRCNYR